jgi:hypothetical protein
VLNLHYTTVTVTVTGFDADEEKLLLLLYRAEIKLDPRLRSLVLNAAAPTVLRIMAGLRALLPS